MCAVIPASPRTARPGAHTPLGLPGVVQPMRLWPGRQGAAPYQGFKCPYRGGVVSRGAGG
jgi:hypothetical protein